MDVSNRYLVEVEPDATIVIVRAPYHPAFRTRAVEVGGHYDGDAWVFRREKEPRVRELCKEVYGTDGADGVPLVTLQLALGKMKLTGRPDLFLAGRRIAYRPQRDARVRLGPRVVVVKGGFPVSGGSTQNPRLEPFEETVVEVMDVPDPAAVAARREFPNHVKILGQPIAAPAKDPALDALLAEREQVQKRLQELDTLIAAEAKSSAKRS